MDHGTKKDVPALEPSVGFGFLSKQAAKKVPHIQLDVIKEKSHSQHSRHNGLYQVASASGVYVKQMRDHEK
jgi:hypothetical protein